MSSIASEHGEKPLGLVRAEAAAWISRLHSQDRSPELEAGLRLWLDENSRHGQVFERMTQAWEDATTVATGKHFPRVRTRKGAARTAWAIAAAVLIVSGLGILSAYTWFGRNTYTTVIGEQRTVRLKDGSKVSVNSASKVVVDYDAHARTVRLERGEAFFEVARDPERPFVVLAGSQRIVALGTAFVVRHETGRTAITLVEGKVAVSDTSAGRESDGGSSVGALKPVRQKTERARILTTGQRLILLRNEEVRLDSPEIDAVTAWRRGEVVLDKTSLADAIAEMNRYDSTRLFIDDPKVAALKVSGIYRSGDNANFARVVARMHGLRVDEEGEEIRIGQ